MATTLTKILLHIAFSTKERADFIPEGLESDLYSYIGGVCRGRASVLLAMGGTANHVHMLVSLGKVTALSDLMLDVKRDSSRWMNERGAFKWQEGYFAFSIGESGVEPLRAYIAGQKEHHAERGFQDEMRAIMTKYKMEWDERYVWD
ncbi:MAG TPA: transposase [Phycisphaerales bacterium]|nr:transposase [Phycisphaerales bacterium]